MKNFTSKSIADDKVKAATQAYIRRLDADIILLQEVHHPAALTALFSPDYLFYVEARKGPQKLVFAYRRHVQIIEPPNTYESLAISRNLRAGLEMAVRLNAHDRLYILGLHLKSLCHQTPLRRTNSKDCQKLSQQIGPLKNWINRHSQSAQAMVIIGDFNRRFDVEQASLDGNWLWPLLFDEKAKGFNAGLVRPGRFQQSLCNADKYPHFIDHFILNEYAAEYVMLNSFEELLFTPDGKDMGAANARAPMAEGGLRLSDHCAIRLQLQARGPRP